MREAIRRYHRIAEREALERLLALQPSPELSARIGRTALGLAERVRATPPGALSAESFLRSYGLTTREGVALMCVAEALLRIPDAQTADALLREKLSAGQWGKGAGAESDDSWAASAADWALMLTGTLARWREAGEEPAAHLKRLVARLGEPVVRTAVRQAMRILASQFVIGETIAEAVHILREYGVSQMPVVRAEPPVMAAEVAGSVSERELLESLYAGTAQLADRVEDHMAAPLPSIGAGEPAAAAVEKLHDADALLVQEDGKPIGVVTRQDLLGFIAAV